jgi:glutamate-ammonia-ligase adenylyltransferase
LFFLASADQLPRLGSAERASLGLQHWNEQVAKLEDGELAEFARGLAGEAAGRGLLDAVFSNSPFLTQCALLDPLFFAGLLRDGPEEPFEGLIAELEAAAPERPDLMRGLRVARRRAALLVALADLTGHWSLEQVTAALTRFADAALSAALIHLLRQAEARGEIALAAPAHPLPGCGLVLLAMGKYGAGELNYSSDIDLIALFEPERIDYRGRRSVQEAMVRLMRDLVTVLEERTGDGYVFRVDLRLRPDPGAMPLAISLGAALTYYESMGQNWERAAMIKARPAAGDLEIGRAFLAELGPFVWRKNLDFWAIQDIHSIKRQINAHKGGGKIALEGQNIKLGRGGIREVEFFAQTQQLIYGGREPRLRSSRTIDALRALAETGRIDGRAAEELGEAYRYLRRLEHRLQMVHDHQTHSLPDSDQGMAEIAAFMAYDSPADFRAALLAVLRRVEDYYAELFEEAPSLSGPGNLVFTGGEPESGTLATLKGLGFEDGTLVFHLVRGWHHSRYRATRSTRAREMLTELMPALLQALGRTPNPDAALKKFDEFLSGLPAGVQLFSLLYANPSLLGLLAEIMGAAPALAEHLSRNPGQLDAVLSPDFFAKVPGREALGAEFATALGQARDYQDVLDLSRRWANDRKFQTGVHILQHTDEVDETGRALSDIAETVLAGILGPVTDDFARIHGRLPGPGLAVLGLGKLGSREMTVGSDLDLIFVYETEGGAETSDGPKPLAASHYYARLAQRYINALSAPTGEGRLYEIDMRLRPSGKAGPIATSLDGFRKYHETDAWTWEHMALTRARVVAGEPGFAARIAAALAEVLRHPRKADRLLVDVADMRRRIEAEHTAESLWSIKHLRGGLVDLEFLAQYLQLRHLPAHPGIADVATEGAFAKLAEAGLLGGATAQRLIEASRLLRAVQGFLRLTAGAEFDETQASDGLKASLARAGGAPDFAALKASLIAAAQGVLDAYEAIVEEPAAAARKRIDEMKETEEPPAP